MKLRIACVGKLKEAYLQAACNEYTKRLARYAQTEVLECPDEPAPERLSDAQRAQTLEREGERLLKCIGAKDFTVALCVDGARYTSERFASSLQQWLEAGGASVTFIIGGSLGLSPAVLARADATFSLSDLTLPHQLARVVLLEQVYRAFRIQAGEPYHK